MLFPLSLLESSRCCTLIKCTHLMLFSLENGGVTETRKGSVEVLLRSELQAVVDAGSKILVVA